MCQKVSLGAPLCQTIAPYDRALPRKGRMSERTRWTTMTLLQDRLELRDRRVLDIGCGDNSLAAALQAAGARPVGLDLPGRPRAAAGTLFVAGSGLALPFPAASFDLVLFHNSLHHLPPGRMQAALEAALGCLRPDGDLVVIEPRPAGELFELFRPIDDEAAIRREAQALAMAGLPGASLIECLDYRSERRIARADDLLQGALGVDPARRATIERIAPTIRAAFEQAGEPHPEGGRLFLQPMLLVHLRRQRAVALEVEEARDRAARDACLALRRHVFVEEQGVPLAEEYEPVDKEASMLLARMDGEPAGTLRWQALQDGRVKVQRVAVAKRWRRRGIAACMLELLLDRLDGAGVPETILAAQLDAQPLYRRFGYRAFGPVFPDGGISHISMARPHPARHEQR